MLEKNKNCWYRTWMSGPHYQSFFCRCQRDIWAVDRDVSSPLLASSMALTLDFFPLIWWTGTSCTFLETARSILPWLWEPGRRYFFCYNPPDLPQGLLISRYRIAKNCFKFVVGNHSDISGLVPGVVTELILDGKLAVVKDNPFVNNSKVLEYLKSD